jgi:hypothetical protein
MRVLRNILKMERCSWEIAVTENRSVCYVQSGNGVYNFATSMIIVIKEIPQ